MVLHEIIAPEPEIKTRVWEKFREYHYTPDRWNPAARVFLATEVFDGKELIVGMSAALAAWGVKFPKSLSVWVPLTHKTRCSHKVVVLPLSLHSGVWGSSEKVLLPDFDRIQMWRTIADAQAALFVKEGHPYYCNAGDAPQELIAYRNDPASGWVPNTKNGHPPRDKGHGKRYGNKPRATNAAGLIVSHWYLGSGSFPNHPAVRPSSPKRRVNLGEVYPGSSFRNEDLSQVAQNYLDTVDTIC
jgi:hypothetical protein